MASKKKKKKKPDQWRLAATDDFCVSSIGPGTLNGVDRVVDL
jgi:hypothetical protein